MRKSVAPSQRSKLNYKATECTTRKTSNVLSLLQSVENREDVSTVPTPNVHDDVMKAPAGLLTSGNENDINLISKQTPETNDVVFKVVWGKKTSKKHKTYEADGVLKISGHEAVLINEDGVKIASCRIQNKEAFENGYQVCIGGKEVEIVEQSSEVTINLKSKRPCDTKSEFSKKLKKSKTTLSCTPPVQITGKKTFFSGNPSLKPLVFPQPTDEYKWNEKYKTHEVRNVTLDSFLTQALRPHQREGILFLYECVMGYRSKDFTGAILADEMGLGKTLQCVALVWTLLKQGPYGTVICKKVLVVVPSSLCSNWYNEFIKWLGRERLEPYVVDKSHNASDFNKYNKSVMIISYEMFVRCYSQVEKNNFDLVVCDEGHKLKNSNIKASQLLNKISCKRRILLTGTPIQNDLQEYFTIVDLVNPGILGTYSEFRKEFEAPILASQKPDCDEDEHAFGSEKALLLNELTSKFMLRRTQDILEKYLPSKREFIICCELSCIQKELYNTAIAEWERKEKKVLPLQMISILKKICNCQSLLCGDASDCQLEGQLAGLIQNEIRFDQSGKLQVIESMLRNLVVSKKEKIVLVSYSTKFLNILNNLCNSLQLHCLRLDGTTPVQKRQGIVDRFNQRHRGVESDFLVFLLSAKAGGVGLNLSSASRLVLVDSDWNPASDLQATARVWRDGQKKGVSIYRLLSTGSIEEKVYQRQVSKTGLSDAVKNPENLKNTLKLSDDELKDLFTPNFGVDSLTHDSLLCDCDGSGTNKTGEETVIDDDVVNGSLTASNKSYAQTESINQLKHWQHFRPPFPPTFLTDAGLDATMGNLNFIFHKMHFN